MDKVAAEVCPTNLPVAGDVGDSALAQVEDQPSNTRKRNPNKCSKCGKSVLNLSRHQKDVHGMKKLSLKLHDYFTGEKKNPRGW